MSEIKPAHKALIDALQRLALARDLEGVQEIVRVAARRLTGADGASLVLREGDNCYYVDEDAIGPAWKGKRFPLETCISGLTMLNRRSAVIEDIYADERIPHDAYRPTFVKSLAMVPIRSRDPGGAIGVYWAETHSASAASPSPLPALGSPPTTSTRSSPSSARSASSADTTAPGSGCRFHVGLPSCSAVGWRSRASSVRARRSR